MARGLRGAGTLTLTLTLTLALTLTLTLTLTRSTRRWSSWVSIRNALRCSRLTLTITLALDPNPNPDPNLNPNPNQVLKAVDEYDQDGNGSLDQSEFERFVGSVRAEEAYPTLTPALTLALTLTLTRCARRRLPGACG